MYPTQNTVTLLKFARLHEADVRASWPAGPGPRRRRRLRLPARPTFRRPGFGRPSPA